MNLSVNGRFLWSDPADVIISNCVFSANTATNVGGGVYFGTLKDSLLISNRAPAAFGGAGGAYGSTLFNCTLRGNSTAYEGGGAYSITASNCILEANSANEGGGAFSSTL